MAISLHNSSEIAIINCEKRFYFKVFRTTPAFHETSINCSNQVDRPKTNNDPITWLNVELVKFGFHLQNPPVQLGSTKFDIITSRYRRVQTDKGLFDGFLCSEVDVQSTESYTGRLTSCGYRSSCPIGLGPWKTKRELRFFS